MLFLVFGASGAGTTSAIDLVRGSIARLECHDFDEIGVPSDADTAWRQRSNELWLVRALELQTNGLDLLLAGQTPPGELLGTPSEERLDGMAACLLNCSDEVRLDRLRARFQTLGVEGEAGFADQIAWAEWLRSMPPIRAGGSTWSARAVGQRCAGTGSQG